VIKRTHDGEYFKWFLASLLFGGRISQEIAKKTYHAFERYHLLTPEKILAVGWEFLVNPIMREGGYVRYDERKSTQLLRDCKWLLDKYQGSLKQLHDTSRDNKDLEGRLLAFYGVGPVTVNIFLRELRPYWRMADPKPLPIVYDMAKTVGLDLGSLSRKTVTFARIEAGLFRLKRTSK
jgi:endonuclease III